MLFQISAVEQQICSLEIGGLTSLHRHIFVPTFPDTIFSAIFEIHFIYSSIFNQIKHAIDHRKQKALTFPHKYY